MTISNIFIFCFMVVGQFIKNLFCLVNLAVVIYVCVFHCNEGTRLIPMYTYGSCWLSMGISWCLKFMFTSCKCVLKACGLSFDLLGHPVIAHLGMPRSIPAHSQNLSILSIWVWRDVTLLAKAAKSSTYTTEFILVLEVLKVYSLFPFCSHRSSGS